MNTQKKLHILKQSLQLSVIVSTMTPEEKHLSANIIKDCDLARLLHKSTIQKELKAVRGNYGGKVKVFLTALSRNPHTMSGVDILFQQAMSRGD